MIKTQAQIPAELVGCARSAHAVVKLALTHNNVYGLYKRVRIEQTNKLRELHRGFALHSDLLKHFCDIYELDYTRVQRRILSLNRSIRK